MRAATLIPRMLKEKDGAVVPLLAETLLAFPTASEVVTYTAAALAALAGFSERGARSDMHKPAYENAYRRVQGAR